MVWTNICAAVIPCFNEAAAIAPLVREVRRFVGAVFVVDDGSSDGTGARAETAGAIVIRHPANRGKGAALKSGMRTAKEHGFAWVIALDGDGQHRAGDIPAFWHCADTSGARLIVGNRMHRAEAIPWLRRFVNRWMSRRISGRAGQFLPDTQCGFRLVNLEASALGLETEHFEIESEMLLAFVRAGHRVEFVPIQVVGRGARSRIHPLADTWRWWKWWCGLPK